MDKEKLNQLCEEICSKIPSGENNIEQSDNFIVDGIKYTYEEGWKIEGEPLFYIEQDFTRSGSYYSDYYYEYEKPYRVEKVKKVIEVEEWVCV